MSNYRNVKTEIPGVFVHVTWVTKADETIIIRAYACDANGIRLDGSKDRKRTCKNVAMLDAAIAQIVNVVCDALPRRQSSGGHDAGINSSLKDQVKNCVKTLMNNEGGINSSWGKSTHRAACTFFLNRILDEILPFMEEGIEFLPSDLENIRQKQINRVMAHGRSRGSLAQAARTVDAELYRSNIIYQYLYENNPSLPQINLAPPGMRGKAVLPEQQKSLPEKLRQMLWRILEKACGTDPELAFCAVLMADAALRTSEAAAILPTDVVWEDDHAYVPVLWQEKNGVRENILKTKNAYRIVVLSHWAAELLSRCANEIEIPDANKTLITSQELSAYILGMLRGYDSALVESAAHSQVKHPDMDEQNRPVNDLAAYILRRDAASRWRNVEGMAQEEIDALLGHRRKYAKRTQIDLRLTEERKRIAAKRERYVYNPERTRNPGFCPIELSHGADLSLIPYANVRLVNAGNEPLRVDLDCTAAEAGEEIHLLTVGNSEVTVRSVISKNAACEIIGKQKEDWNRECGEC